MSRPLTDDEIADQMIKRGGRDARLGQALKEGLISKDQLSIRREGIIKQRNVNIPKVETPEDLLRRVAREGEVAQSIRPGIQASVSRFELGGHKVLYKQYVDRGRPMEAQRAEWDETAHKEVLSSKLADAIGAPVPKAVRYGDRSVVQEWVDIRPNKGSIGGPGFMEAEGAKELGLLDYLIGNSDRHAGNYFYDDVADRVVGIDHGLVWSNVGGSNLEGRYRSPFFRRWIDGADTKVTGTTDISGARHVGFSADELLTVRRRIRDIKPEFQGRDRMDWYNATIDRLDALIKNG